MFETKNCTIQSAGMEDGLIDLIVVQLLVRMYKEEPQRFKTRLKDGCLFSDPAEFWNWDVEFE